MADTQRDEFQANLPGGFQVKIFGKEVVQVIIILLLFGYIAYVNYIAQIDHLAIAKELRINTYILSLPQDKRPELVPPIEIWERMKILSKKPLPVPNNE